MNIDTLREAFGERAFTTSEAAWALGLKSATGTLSRLKTRGLLVSEGVGRFRLAPATFAPVLAARLAEERLRRLLAGPVPLALDGPDAVALWTDGRYHPAVMPGAAVVHVACAPKDAGAAALVLEMLGIPWSASGEWPRGRGLKAVLRSAPRLRRVRRGGFPVISRHEVVRLIRSNKAAYEGAEEWLVR